MTQQNTEIEETDKEMNLVGHLQELRNRLILTAVLFIVMFILAFVFIKRIYQFFTGHLDFTLNITSPGDILWIYITMSGIAALAITLPVLITQVWLFVKPGLTNREQKASLPYIPAVFILFIGGLTFGYVIFLNLILPFLLSMNDGMFNELFTVDKYFSFMFKLVIPFAFIFEVPIIAMFLTSIGFLTPRYMRKIRKYAYFVLVIVGAALTPPDIFLQFVVAIPMFILYETSIYLCDIVYKRKQRRREEHMDDSE